MSGDVEYWWVDEPIASEGADLLDRAVFVDRVRDLIAQIGNSQGSTVIGLIGPWGSGKSSTINMIVSGLDATRWGITRVTPWALTGSDSVISELLAGVAGALPNQRGPSKKARAALMKYGAFLTPTLSALPVVGNAARAVSDAMLARLKGSTVHDQIEEVSADLRDLARPILVVVDDMDRLQREELLGLFRGVRILGRLPYVHYLLAYDEQTVLDVLETTEIAKGNRDRALAFLEKIVTLRLDQPPTRAEQAAAILAAGLAKVVAESLGSTLSEETHARLDDEREAILSPLLTEPRAIARFLTQLRTYLPIVGVTEVDFVDYAVVTLLRLTYPELFRALLSDKDILVGADRTVENEQLLAWSQNDQLRTLHVPERHLTRVSGALQRLFPRLVPDGAAIHALDRDNRRRDQRASDPDYVDRYFALTAQTDELADALIADALQEWSTGHFAVAAEAFGGELAPAPSDDTACARSARLIRRATSRSDELTPAAAGAVLHVFVGYLPLPRNGGVDSAAINWIAALLSKAEHLDSTELLRLIERPPEQISPLSYLLRAIRLIPAPSNGEIPDEWSTLTDKVTEAAWDRFLAHVRLGDNAPIEPVGFLVRWLDEVIGPDAVNQRLSSALGGGLSLTDVAARLMEVGTDPTGASGHVTPISTDALLHRLGRARVLRHRDELLSAAGAPSSPVNLEVTLEDLSWSNRKAAAASQLLAATERQGPVSLPKLDTIQTPATLLNHEPDLIGPAIGQEPDLKAQLTVLLPAGSTVPTFDSPTQAPVGQQREDIVLQLLTDAPITTWLSRTASSWHLKPGNWRISDAHPRSSTSATLDSTADWSKHTPGRQPPIRIGAQMRTGLALGTDDNSKSALLLTITLGVWLAELNSERRPDEVRHNERPLPAALTLDEASELATALFATTSTAFTAFQPLTGSEIVPGNAIIDLNLYANGGLASVIDLRDIQVIRDRNSPNHRMTIVADRPRATAAEDAALSLALATISEWLLEAGYRGHEDRLLRILESKYA